MPSLTYHRTVSSSHSTTGSDSSVRLPRTPPPQSTVALEATPLTSASPKSVVVVPLATTAVASVSLWPPSVETTLSHHLPRTSSLLPPPRIATNNNNSSSNNNNNYAGPGLNTTRPTFHDPFNAPSVHSLLRDSEPEPEPDAARRPSRSSSIGGLSDSFRNLNRWSASSTTSSGYGHARKTSTSSRRASLGIFGLKHGSPKKLQKHQQSRSSLFHESPPRFEATTTGDLPPFQTLPSIAALPSLDLQLSPPGDRLAFVASKERGSSSRARTDDEISADYWDGAAAAPDETPVWTAHVAGKVETRLPSYYSREPTMPYQMPYQQEPRGPSRNRSSTGATSDSLGSGSGSAARDRDRERDRERDRDRTKQPSQKAMLSKALQKANTAVQLDNAQNAEEARQAYAEACELLQQVLQRTGGDEDRKKLEAIRETYTKRIDELDLLLPPPPYGAYQEKALPRRPGSLDRPDSRVATASDLEDAVVETATVTRIVREGTDMRWGPAAIPSYAVPTTAARRQQHSQHGQHGAQSNLHTHTPQLSIETSLDDPDASSNTAGQPFSLQSSFSRSPMRADSRSASLQPRGYLGLPTSQYLPPPLSPRRSLSPGTETGPVTATDADYTAAGRLVPGPAAGARGHRRDNSHESVSWLDPIEESGGSAASSVHSRSSSAGIRRKHIRAPSGETEAEFDAALDDAIEAAYNEGYEPDDGVDPMDSGMGVYQEQQEENPDDAMASVLRRVELAREAVRASEREAMTWASERENRLRLQQQEEEDEELLRQQQTRNAPDHDPDQHGQGTLEQDLDHGNDSEDEERLLDKLSKEYAMQDFTFTASQKQASVPRQSDSSGLTSRTWHSSMPSNPTASTSTPMLTTVSESTVTSTAYANAKLPLAQPLQPPSQPLPQLPPPSVPSAASLSLSQDPSNALRSRRLSGNAKQLKIETSTVHHGGPGTAAGPAQAQTKSGGYIAQQRQALSAGVQHIKAAGSTPVAYAAAQGERPGLKKKLSSSSLRSMKSRNMSVSNTDNLSDNMSPGTPLSNSFGLGHSSSQTQLPLPAMPNNVATPLTAAFHSKDRTNNTSTGGFYLFDHDMHNTRHASTSPNPLVGDGPVALEPCPTDSMLRPFWLMRCLYQTLCHARGGYISNKLFVPRDVWRVKGVKLKSVEDKIANCDFLTAALQKLAKVDNCDADAVLEEMQTLEGVLEQVQAVLTRKLGNEVGVHGASHLFKETGAGGSAAADGESASSIVPRSASISGKGSSAFSWRRLRGKNSSAGLSSAYAGKGASGGAMSNTPTVVEGAVSTKDTVVSSLPMTSHPTSRPLKRDPTSVQFGGPNANYMAALARLFDAAQTVDQIARQVEDPGLRHADKTQVGLELCTRHAAEFFGFYICRFVLTDLTMLLDKFVKRGSEWVLA